MKTKNSVIQTFGSYYSKLTEHQIFPLTHLISFFDRDPTLINQGQNTQTMCLCCDFSKDCYRISHDSPYGESGLETVEQL